jgi:molybdopterin-guanine dinucleotide biosynthesis protein A
MAGVAQPIGAVLAGGAGRRIGGSKAMVELRGRPLICYPLAVVRQVLTDVVVVAKPSTELPSMPGVTVWLEPEEPSHPLIGILHALSLADGRPILVCAGDLPFVTPDALERLIAADPGDAPAVIATAGGRTQPLLGCYQPVALERLSPPGQPRAEAPLRDTVARAGARTLEVDPDVLFNVNYPEDLLRAAAMLDYPNVKS